MSGYPPIFQRLVNKFSGLPSIGGRTAERLALFLAKADREDIASLAESLLKFSEVIRECSVCRGISDAGVCSICSSKDRMKNQICIVEKPSDLVAVEKAGQFKGMYHVMHGLWSPMKGVGREQLGLDLLLERIQSEELPSVEIIVATGSSIEGDATALYIGKIFSFDNIKVTRIAQGIPKGLDLELLDQVTIAYALEGRKSV